MSLAQILQASYRRGGPENDCLLKLRDDNEIRAHSLVLKLYSDVFAAKLGVWAEVEDKASTPIHNIKCMNFDSQLMKKVIDDLYYDNIILNGDNVRDYVEICSFYLIGSLQRKCELFINSTLLIMESFELLQYSETYQLHTVYGNCLHVIDENAVILLNNARSLEDFVQLTQENVIKIIERVTLAVNEDLVLNALFKWVDKKERAVDIQDRDIPFCFENFVPYIRFLSLSREAVNNVIEKNLLCFEEAHELLQAMVSHPEIDNTFASDIFNTVARNVVPELRANVVSRFCVENNPTNWKGSEFEGDRISFATDTTTNLLGVNLFGNPNEVITVVATILDHQNKVVRQTVINARHKSTFPVVFTKLLRIPANVPFTVVCQVRENKLTSYGSHGITGRTVTTLSGNCFRVSFKNFYRENMSNDTDINHGQLNRKLVYAFYLNANMTVTLEQQAWLKKYFSYGYSQALIYYLMVKNHGVNFRYILGNLGLYRRGHKALSPFNDILAAIMTEMNTGAGSILSANEILAILRIKHGLKVTRDLVREMVRIIDPVGVQQRHSRRLIRREYRCKGPNYVWHIDGYDKLSQYGLPIYGCIDGFSRKILWLKVGASNHDPKKVAAYYLEVVKKQKGCPRIIRADRGTETGVIMTLQAMLRANGEDVFSHNSYWYGSSTSNQRIERWWGIFRIHSSDWWIDHFKVLVTNGHLQLGNPVHVMSVQYCYMEVLQTEIDEVVVRWNHHRIRKQTKGDTVSGIPEIMYDCPELLNRPDCRNFIHQVDVDSNLFRFSQSQCITDNNGDKDFALVARNICRLNNWIKPANALEARDLFLLLTPCMDELFLTD